MEKVYLFGGGNQAYGVVQYIGKENIVAIIDNEVKRQGDKIEGIEVISFEQYLNQKKDEEIVITVAMYETVVAQLMEQNITNYSIAPMIQMGMADVEEIIDTLQLREEKKVIFIGYNIVSEKLYDSLKQYNEEVDIRYALVDDREKMLLERKGRSVTALADDRTKKVIVKENFSEQEKRNYKNIVSVYDVIPKSNNEYQIRIQKFKNSQYGKKCFIIGNGPSLQCSDLEKLAEKNIPCFGLNLIYSIFGKTNWRPQYYVITEYNLYRTYLDEIQKIECDNIFIKNFYSLKDNERLKDVIYYPACAERAYNEYQKFSEDISKKIYSGYSVMYDAIQIAVYLGYREIYLLGADFSYIGDAAGAGNHIYDDVHTDRRKVAGKSYIDVTLTALKIAKEYADAHGIRIYNATRGGKLEVFERINMDDFFAKKNE